MKKLLVTLLVTMAMVSSLVVFVGCEKGSEVVSPQSFHSALEPNSSPEEEMFAPDENHDEVAIIHPGMLALPGNQADKVSVSQDVIDGLMAWNNSYANDVQAVSLQYLGVIADAGLRDLVVGIVTDPTVAYAPFGWADEPSSISAKLMGGFDYDAAVFNAFVDGLIQVGHEVYATGWTKGSVNFTSYAVVDATGTLVFDDMLSHTLYVASESFGLNEDAEPIESCPSFNITYGRTCNWAWPFNDNQRGKAEVVIHIDCGCDGPSCQIEGETFEKTEDMQIGNANARCEFYTDSFGTRRAAVAVTMSTCTADVDVEIDVEVGSVTLSAHGLGTHVKSSHSGIDVECEGTCPDVIDAGSRSMFH